MTQDAPDRPVHKRGADAIHRAEQVVYAAIAVMLILALAIAIAGSGKLLWDGLADWSGTRAIFEVIDRLLFVLMLVEILHTVHASIRTGTLVAEPFLIVGLIACIRRILVITLETSQITRTDHWSSDVARLFYASMIELGVLAASSWFSSAPSTSPASGPTPPAGKPASLRNPLRTEPGLAG